MSNFTFDTAPSIKAPRSKFNLSHGVKTSMSAGKLYPLRVLEVLPGDTFDCNAVAVSRVSTAFLRPVMDNVFLDVYFFFVPSRLEFDKWGEIFGENNDSAWARSTEVTAPMTGGTVSPKTVADYMGLPISRFATNLINVLPFRAFADIWNEWFRNENTVAPVHVQRGSTVSSEYFNNNAWAPNNYTGKLPNVMKKKDYFTSALPSPQKGNAVTLGVLGDIPVNTKAMMHSSGSIPLHVHFNTGGVPTTDSYDLRVGNYNGFGVVYGADEVPPMSTANRMLIPDNLWAEASSATSISVNDLRVAVQSQKLLERAARGGTRYREYLLSAFGVSNGDARMQIPEFLGGKRIPLNIQQVTQTNTQQATSSETVQSPLGSLGATSLTNGRARFIKSFTEHGYLFCVGCIRQLHTYQQGVPKMFMREKQLDFYDPLFQSIGEQPIWQSELFVPSTPLSPVANLKSTIFGFTEAWSEYRFSPSVVTGQMRSGVDDSFDVWHFADYYSAPPTLSESFTNETSQYIDRTLAAPSSQVDEFLLDLWFDIKSYRRMPVRSIPGYVDHY